jgi:site-specific recombinase
MTREEMINNRLEQLAQEDSSSLRDRMNLGIEATKFTQTTYWQNLEEKLLESIDSAKKRKNEFSFIQMYHSPNDKSLEVNALIDEITINNYLNILDIIKFHIEDGKLAEKVLRQKV